MDASFALNNVFHMLENAKSDCEKLAALLLVTKFLKADEMTAADSRALYEKIGFKFLNRLLRTSNTPEGCSQNTFKLVAVCILRCFASDSHLALHSKMLDNLSIFNTLITGISSFSEDMEEKLMVTDIYEILISIVSTPEGSLAVEHAGTVTALCHVIINKSYGWQEGLPILEHLISTLHSKIWVNNEDGLLALVEKLSREIKTSMDTEKFEACRLLCKIILCTDEEKILALSNRSFWDDVRSGIMDILQSRIGETHREAAMNLVSVIIGHYNMEWLMFNDSRENVLLRLVINLASVEVQLRLEELAHSCVQKNDGELKLVVPCLLIVEKAVDSIRHSTSALKLDNPQTVQLVTALDRAFTAIVAFLRENDNNLSPSSFYVILFQVLGSFIEELELAVGEDVVSLIPVILRICFTAVCEQHMDHNACTSDSSLLAAGIGSVTLTDETSPMYSVHSAICVKCLDDQQVSVACDDDYEIVEGAVAANENWNSNSNCLYANSFLDKCVDSSVSGAAEKYIETRVAPSRSKDIDIMMEQQPFNITGCTRTVCVTSAVISVCKTQQCVLHETALKLSYETPCLPGGDAMNVMHHMLLGLRNMCARDEIRINLIQKGAHVIFVNYFWSILDMCMKDETESKSSSLLVPACDVLILLARLLPSFHNIRAVFTDLLFKLVHLLPEYFNEWKLERYISRMYLTALSLTLIGYLPQELLDAKINIEPFVKVAVDGLSEVLTREKTESGFSMCAHSTVADMWEFISEPYYISIWALCDCVTYNKVVADCLLSNGWLTRMVCLLLDVKGESVSKECLRYHHLLLFLMAKIYPEAKKVITEAGGIHLSELYCLRHLGSHLA